MKRAAGIIHIAALLIGLCVAKTGNGRGGAVYVITLDDDIISPVSAEYIIKSIEKAEENGATCLIMELDTPGGLLSSTRSIVKKMMNAKIPVVAYVAPKGARAGSAGVFITLASSVAAMAPSTNIGAAHPIDLAEKRSTPEAIEELVRSLDKKGKAENGAKKTVPADEKILNDTKAWAEAIAKNRGRNTEWALKAVEESVSVTDAQALKLGIIDIIANDTDELIKNLNGRKAMTAEGTSALNTAGADVIFLPKNFRLRWLTVLAHPNIAYILLMLGFYGLLFEVTHPGIGFPGIAGAVSLILAFFGLQVLPTNYAGIALIILAIAMFIAEIKVVSYGLLTLGGMATLFLGSLILFESPYDFMRVSIPIIASFTAATLVITSFLIFIVMRSRSKKASTGKEGLIGIKGEVVSWNGLSGKVLAHGEVWSARSDVELAKSDAIEVTDVEGMILVVKKMN